MAITMSEVIQKLPIEPENCTEVTAKAIRVALTPLHTEQPDKTHWKLWCHGAAAFDACFRCIEIAVAKVAGVKLPEIQLTDNGQSIEFLDDAPFKQFELRFTQWRDQHAIAIRQALANVKSPLRLIIGDHGSHADQLKSHRILECVPCFDRIGTHLLCVNMIKRWRGSQMAIEKHALSPDADVAATATSDLAELTALSNRIHGVDSASAGVDDQALLVWKQIAALVTRCPLLELRDNGRHLACFQVVFACRAFAQTCSCSSVECHAI